MIKEFEAALDELCGADPQTLGDGETVKFLHRCLARLEAATTRASAAFDTSGEWEADGARSAAAWLAGRCSVPVPVARRRLRVGRALRHLPVTEKAWLAGDIGSAHVSALASARTPVTEEAMARDEAVLVGQSQELHLAAFLRVLAYWSQRADPDGTEDTAARQREGRRFHLSQSFGGTWLGDLVLDPIAGAVVDNELGRIERAFFEADWAEARARLGQGACAADLLRTGAQRRADALVEMARRSGTAPAGGRRPQPLFSVLVDYETFAGRICQLANNTVVSPGSLVGWLDEALIERVVFAGPSRVIDVGVRQRLFSGALRTALASRDQECFEKFCDVPAGKCQGDHVIPWAMGGETTQDNGRMACGFHNRQRHRGPPAG